MLTGVSITAPDRYVRLLRADGSQVSRHLTVEDAIEGAVNTGPGDYRITYPDRIVKVYGVLPSTPAPAAPTDLTTEEVTAGYVSLSWTDDGNGTSWTVYRDGAPIGNASNASYTDTTVVPGTLYSFQVQASNSSGSSALSDALAVTTSANSLPGWSLLDQSGYIGQAYALDLNTVCEDGDGQSLAFTLVSGSVPGLALTASDFAGSPTTVGAYALTFRVDDGYGTADVAITFNVYDPDVTAPTVPTNVQASVNGSTVTVTWTGSTDAGSGVATYKVYRDGVFRANDTASPYVETGVPVGTYSYTVSAVDASANDNESAQSSAALATVAAATPDTPVSFTAISDGATTINLSWAPGPNGTTPDDYDIDFSTTSASGPWTAITFVGAATTYAHTGRTAGVTHYYRIRAGLGALESGYATATSGTGKPWDPGNYIGSSVDPSLTAVQTICNYVAPKAYLKGVNIRPFWGQLEPSQGVYNFDLIDEALAILEPAGKKLWVMIQTAKFNTSSSSLFPAFLPSYLNNATYDGGGYAQLKSTGKYDLVVKLWNANVITRKVALISALHARYASNPNVQGFIAAESALGLVSGEAGYTPSAFVTQLVRLFTLGRAAAPSKHLMMLLNYISGGGGTDANFQTICDSLRDNRWVLGGPDSLYTENGSTGRKFAIGVQGTTDYRGTMAMNSGDQTSGLNNTSYVNADWMNWCKNTAQSNWNIWVYLTGTANFNSLMTYLSANPTAGFTSTRPSGY